MSLRRVVIPDLSSPQGALETGHSLALAAPYVHYLQRVLRLGEGDELELCDGRGQSWIARVTASQADAFSLVLHERLPPTIQPFPVYLAQAMPKSDRFEQILQRCTELGVAGFFPFYAKRCVVRLEPKRLAKKMERWRRIVQEACRQCERTSVPLIATPTPIADVVAAVPPESAAFVCVARDAPVALDAWIEAHPQASGVVVFVGPEGGFELSEIEMLAASSISGVGLGPLILRTETAGPAISAILQHAYGCLGRGG